MSQNFCVILIIKDIIRNTISSKKSIRDPFYLKNSHVLRIGLKYITTVLFSPINVKQAQPLGVGSLLDLVVSILTNCTLLKRI